MKTSPASTTNFNGKIFFDKSLSKQAREFANNILDYPMGHPILKEPLRKKIKAASYDVIFYSKDTKKTVHPKLWVQSKFNVLDDETPRAFGHKIRLDSSTKTGALNLAEFLFWFEDAKKSYKNSYNGFWEKMALILKNKSKFL